MIYSQKPSLDIKDPPTVVNRIPHNTDDSLYHMKRLLKLFSFDNITVPMFFQNYYDLLPSNILGEHTHFVKESEIDRVDNIAYKEYNNPELWWLVCYINNIDPFNLTDKTVLRILQLDMLVKNYLRYEI
jgi:hypothetical protein